MSNAPEKTVPIHKSLLKDALSLIGMLSDAANQFADVADRLDKAMDDAESGDSETDLRTTGAVAVVV